MSYCYDRNGKPISEIKFSELIADTSYLVVRKTPVGDAEVSTVWLGVDHGFSFTPKPLIFETMIFGGPYDTYQWRYATEIEALSAHEAIVTCLRTGNDPSTTEVNPDEEEVEFE